MQTLVSASSGPLEREARGLLPPHCAQHQLRCFLFFPPCSFDTHETSSGRNGSGTEEREMRIRAFLKPGRTEQLIEIETHVARLKKATREYLASLTQLITGRKYAAGAVKRVFYKRHELNRARCVMTCSGKW